VLLAGSDSDGFRYTSCWQWVESPLPVVEKKGERQNYDSTLGVFLGFFGV